MLSRSVLSALKCRTGHVLDHKLFAYCEELDLCVRARKLGYRVVSDRAALIEHTGSASSGSRWSAIVTYYMTRNRLLLAKRFLPLFWKLLFLQLACANYAVRAFKHWVGGNRAKADAVCQGLLDGLAGRGGKWRRHDSAVDKNGEKPGLLVDVRVGEIEHT